LKKVQELAQAELNAAIANEKAAQLEKMSEANINVSFLLESMMDIDTPIFKLVIANINYFTKRDMLFNRLHIEEYNRHNSFV
jgi:hypothetical protein